MHASLFALIAVLLVQLSTQMPISQLSDDQDVQTLDGRPFAITHWHFYFKCIYVSIIWCRKRKNMIYASGTPRFKLTTSNGTLPVEGNEANGTSVSPDDTTIVPLHKRDCCFMFCSC